MNDAYMHLALLLLGLIPVLIAVAAFHILWVTRKRLPPAPAPIRFMHLWA